MIKTKKIPIFTKGNFILIALFFTFGIYLSIPVLFNYKSIEKIVTFNFLIINPISLKLRKNKR